MRQVLAAAVLSLFCAVSLFAKEEENAAQKAELQKKIAEYREKSSKVVKKITRDREEAQQEQAAHERYKENFEAELARLEKEKSELNREQNSLVKSSDSLSRKIASVRRKSKELSLQEKQFTESLLGAIDLYAEAVNEVPAPVLTKESESLAFLKRELEAGSISNIEAIERLWQVIAMVNKNRLSVDVWSATSTWEGITGQSHYLRLGYAYLATVNDESTTGAVWNGSGWSEITSPNDILALRTAVKIRNGNTLPAIVSLPLVESSETEEVSDEL